MKVPSIVELAARRREEEETTAADAAARPVKTEDFDLDAEISKLYEEAQTVDPAELAEILLPRIPPSGLRAIVRRALPTYIRIWLGGVRRHHVSGAGPFESSRARSGQFVRSVKLNAVAIILRESCHIDGRYVTLGECGMPELAFMVAERKRIAEGNLASAARYERLRQRLQEHGVKLVQELPEKIILSFAEEAR